MVIRLTLHQGSIIFLLIWQVWMSVATEELSYSKASDSTFGWVWQFIPVIPGGSQVQG
jgi:hypothetical protein